MKAPSAITAFLVFVVLSAGMVSSKADDPAYGIGAVVRPDSPAGTPTQKAVVVDHVNIVDVVPKSAADKAGLQKGDEIIQIDDANVVGMNFYDIVTKEIRGKEGTSVKVTVKRNGKATPISFTVVRGGPPIYSLNSH